MIGSEVVIVGAGIIGLTVARELLKRGVDRIVIVEKEKDIGCHASGRNSGVLHAGVYYTPDSFKAKSCLSGNRLLKEYCLEKGLPLKETGKVIVTKRPEDISHLFELYKRAIANGATVSLIDEKELSEIEPSARTYGKALFVRETASVDPKAILTSLKKDLESSGKVLFMIGSSFVGIKGSRVCLTSKEALEFDIFINASGAYSDRVAHTFGLAKNYRILPFKGIYWKLRKDIALTASIRGHIYPVPDLRYPFLGIHFSKNVYGEVYVGPTAIPAFGREHYGIIKGIDGEAPLILARNGLFFLSNNSFRKMAFREFFKYVKKFFFRDASKLVKELRMEDLVPSSKVGVRPQLVDLKTKKLEMDFVVLKDGSSIHVLNPISPAFTASMDIARKLADML